MTNPIDRSALRGSRITAALVLVRGWAPPHLLLWSFVGLPIAFVIILRFFWPDHGLLDISDQPIGRDFLNVWAGSRLILSGHVATLFDLNAYHSAVAKLFGEPLEYPPTWSYPPHIIYFTAALAALSYPVALGAWTIMGLFGYAAVVLSFVAKEKWSTLFFALCLAPSSIVNLISGQNGFFSAMLFLGGLRLADKRPFVAGILIGCLTMKPHLGLLIPFVLLLDRNWKALLAATCTATVLIAASFVMEGSTSWVDYFAVTTRLQQMVIFSFDGFYSLMMPSVFSSLRLLGVPPLNCGIAQAIVGVPVFVMALLGWRRSSDPAVRILIIAAATFLVLPYSFNYDMTILSGALLWFSVSQPLRSAGAICAVAATWLLPVAIFLLHLAYLPIAPFVLLSVFALAMSRSGEMAAGTSIADLSTYSSRKALA